MKLAITNPEFSNLASLLILIGVNLSFTAPTIETYSLTVSVSDLQNSNGVVQYSLYNSEDCFPDEYFEKEIKQLTAKIERNASSVTFTNLPKGTYAVNILHDEDADGEIKKGWFLPIEGVGFSNLSSINPLNRPSFENCKFDLHTNKSIKISITYM